MCRVASVVLGAVTGCGGRSISAPASSTLSRNDSLGSDALRPGDKVRLKIWREPDLSGDYDVDENGRVLLPKIGSMIVSGMSADSAKRTIVASFQSYLRNPTIEVVLLKRINVLGAVRTPGLYPVDPTMTISDVLALAGGAAPDGKPDRVRLLRGGAPVTVKLTTGTRVSDTPLRGGDQLYVPQRSWLDRNLIFVIGTGVGVTGLIVRLITD